MICNCDKMRIRVTGWRTDSYFENMDQVAEDSGGWRKILRCPKCSQKWLVDEYDKVQDLFGIKIYNPNDTSDSKLLALHKDCLLEKYGGESDLLCQMANCENYAVTSFAFCAECLIQKRGVFQ